MIHKHAIMYLTTDPLIIENINGQHTLHCQVLTYIKGTGNSGSLCVIVAGNSRSLYIIGAGNFRALYMSIHMQLVDQ